MSPADLTAAAELAAARHIPFRTEGGKLLVPPAEVERFRGLLAYEGVLDREKILGFEELADQNDIWRTEAQKAKRWQAAKMAALSRLIGHFPAVQRATVIFEPGIPRGLGRSPVPPTAAVKVVMGDGERMTAKLASAVADLVAGSITGMERKDVRIVDNAGRSYRPDAEGGNIQEDPVEQLARLDSYYQARIHAALHYIRNVVAGVSVATEGPSGRCKAASVCLPRSYLAAIYRSANAGADPNDAALEKFAAPRLARIRRPPSPTPFRPRTPTR